MPISPYAGGDPGFVGHEAYTILEKKECNNTNIKIRYRVWEGAHARLVLY